jgi:hypothetical protein
LGNRLFVTNSRTGTVGKYDAMTGDAINVSFITGLNGPAGLALLGNTLFVANSGAGTVGKYDANSGVPAAAPWTTITGLNEPVGLALLGNTLFVTSSGAGTVGTYDAKTGGAINASLVTGFVPAGIAVQSNSD